ncbi:F-box protein SKIP23-like [Chenopodium quinoa]|uniref:F-box protein SKIP23-like n=1 Tax=Chenopodium quinoa TaxID=63459 RepID=UPI000B771E8B|nr:F-box protein SKIP23-like [Chenopodium quinoa]
MNQTMSTISGDSSSGGGQRSRWPDLPDDILSSIADRIDPKIGTLRLRSVCRSWHSSLSPLPSSITFPLKLPFPLSNGVSTSPSQLSLSKRTVYLLSPPENFSNGGFLIKVEEREGKRNGFSLFDPLLSYSKFPQPNLCLNLLDYRVSVVCESYVVNSDLGLPQNPFKKAVVAKNFAVKGDFVVLGLKLSGELLIWRIGDEQWTEIGVNGRSFDDIISYNGKFYATADRKGRLVMIDSRLKPLDLVPKLVYGNGMCTYLVECDGNLYVVDRVGIDDGRDIKLGVFKLDDKGHFWDYESDLNDCVFFVGDDANFSLSRNDYYGDIRNVIYFKGVSVEEEGDRIGGIDEFTKVFDMKTNSSSYLVESESYAKLYWPPSSWFQSGCSS